MEKFTCPNCKEKISFKEVFIFTRNHQTTCKKCSTILKPRKTKSFNFGAIIGFLSVVLPAKIYLFYEKNFLHALEISVCSGILAILSIAYYTYKTTEFIEV